jgi:hypothetical protein
MGIPTLQFDRVHNTQEYRQMSEQIEWIRTSEAAEILDVKSTQSVLFLVRGEEKPYKWIVRYWNVGTEDMPRYMLAKEDIIALAKKRKSQTDL